MARPTPKRRHARKVVVIAMAVALAVSCLEPTAGQVDLSAFDVPAEKALAFPAGKHLQFAVHLEDYEYSGGNQILLHVTLLRGGAPVQEMSCSGQRFKSGSGCGSSATSQNSACAIEVPAGGSDAIRIVATLNTKSNTVGFKALSVYLRD